MVVGPINLPVGRLFVEEVTTAPHPYAQPGRYTIAVKVIDIFGNDTMMLVPVTVG